MFAKLFGSTKEEQLDYLQSRILLTILVFIISAVIMSFSSTTGNAVIAIVAYVWAWSFLKNWAGITTLGAIFSGNLAIGVIIFMVYLVIGYVIGLMTFSLGLIRYIQLKVFGAKIN